jgi:hypothetical protein
MIPTVGRIVLYTLNDRDIIHVGRRRITRNGDIGNRPGWPLGAQAHVGNHPNQEPYPMIITRVWMDNAGVVSAHSSVNGQVFLDGNDVLWVESVLEGVGQGTWAWPSRT